MFWFPQKKNQVSGSFIQNVIKLCQLNIIHWSLWYQPEVVSLDSIYYYCQNHLESCRVHFKEWKDLCFVVRFKFPIAALFTAGLTSLAVLHLYPFTAAQQKGEPEQSLTITVRKNSSLWGKVDSTEPRSSYTALTQTHRLAKGIQSIRSLWEETGWGIPNKETGKLILAETRAFSSKIVVTALAHSLMLFKSIQKYEPRAQWTTKTAFTTF